MSDTFVSTSADDGRTYVLTFVASQDGAEAEQRRNAVLAALSGAPIAPVGSERSASATGTEKKMSTSSRRAVGIYLIAFGVILLGAIPWVWSFASLAITPGKAPARRSSFFGLGFTPTAEFSMVLVVLLSAMLGSVAVMTLTFANRAGHDTLEPGYVWWYMMRPVTTAALGLLFYLAVSAGFFRGAAVKEPSALVVAAVLGGLAGLFTDQVLTKMRSLLGLLPTNVPASGTDEATA